MLVGLIARAITNCVLCLLLFGLPLFLGAGSLHFWNGWLFLGIFVGALLGILLFFAFSNPGYFRKRTRIDEKEKPQRAVMALLVVCALAMLLVSGLDYRLRWSCIPTAVVAAAAFFMAGGFSIVFATMMQNSYASRVVEIQEGQKVIDSGLYALVRHPMYLGFSIVFLVSPAVLGSLFSLIPAVFIPFVLTFRIGNEEKILLQGLPGYDLYMKKVKCRLIPFLW